MTTFRIQNVKNKIRFSAQPSGVKIFFRDHQIVALKRSELYTYTDFFAIVGGLLGLFMGVSILSLVEFVYYSTLRLYWSIKQWKSKNVVAAFKPNVISTVKSSAANAPTQGK